MTTKSIFYKNPWLYILGLKWIHKSNFKKRYQFMSSFVKKGDRVLEPGCGPGILLDFLPQGSDYRGFDTNLDFIQYAKKRGPGFSVGNVLDLDNYNKAEVVIICDVLHHINPKDRERFIKNCFDSAEQLFIICDPGQKTDRKPGILSEYWMKLTEWAERDGTNKVRSDYFLNHEQLMNAIEHGFGVIPARTNRKMVEIGEDIIAIFYKQDENWKERSKRKTVSAIVPVFNEERTVSQVINTLLSHPLIDEIICINDGSTDASMEAIHQFRGKIEIIDLINNCGKGYALSTGIEKAKGDIVAFFDADLINLTDAHIDDLLRPVLTGYFSGVVGYSVSGKRISINIFTNLTGERAYLKSELTPYLEDMAKTRFGVEVFLNHLFEKEKIKKVPLIDLKGLLKHQKRNLPDTSSEYINEGIEILQELFRQV